MNLVPRAVSSRHQIPGSDGNRVRIDRNLRERLVWAQEWTPDEYSEDIPNREYEPALLWQTAGLDEIAGVPSDNHLVSVSGVPAVGMFPYAKVTPGTAPLQGRGAVVFPQADHYMGSPTQRHRR